MQLIKGTIALAGLGAYSGVCFAQAPSGSSWRKALGSGGDLGLPIVPDLGDDFEIEVEDEDGDTEAEIRFPIDLQQKAQAN